MNILKSKREHSSKLKTVLFSSLSLLLLALLLISLFLVNAYSSPAFATAAWEDPHLVCTTLWLYDNDSSERTASLQAIIQDLDLEIELISVSRFHSRGMCRIGGDELQLVIAVSPEQIADTAYLGNIVGTFIEIFADEASSFAPSVLNITFQNSETNNWGATWFFELSQAQRAVAAGLRGTELFNIGR